MANPALALSSDAVLEALSGIFPPSVTTARRISSGRFGVVYKVHCALLKREYAVKVAMASDATSIDTSTTINERCILLSTVGHCHLLRLLHAGYSGGLQFLIVELLDGNWEKMELEMASLPMKERLEQAERHFGHCLSALEYLHSIPLIHRDIKPDNLLVRRAGDSLCDGTTLLADHSYGAGNEDALKFLSSLTVYASPHRMLYVAGTPPRTSEEGDKSDVYSAAVSAMVLVVGFKDFMGPSMAFDAAPRHFASSRTCRPFALHRLPVIKKWFAKHASTFHGTSIALGATFDQDSRPTSSALCIDSSPLVVAPLGDRNGRMEAVEAAFGYPREILEGSASAPEEYSAFNAIDFLLEEIRLE